MWSSTARVQGHAKKREWTSATTFVSLRHTADLKGGRGDCTIGIPPRLVVRPITGAGNPVIVGKHRLGHREEADEGGRVESMEARNQRTRSGVGSGERRKRACKP